LLPRAATDAGIPSIEAEIGGTGRSRAPLRAQYRQIRNEVRQAIDEVIESQQFILGPAVKGFEEQTAAYLSCAHAVGVASGSDALLLALMALGMRDLNRHLREATGQQTFNPGFTGKDRSRFLGALENLVQAKMREARSAGNFPHSSTKP